MPLDAAKWVYWVQDKYPSGVRVNVPLDAIQWLLSMAPNAEAYRRFLEMSVPHTTEGELVVEAQPDVPLASAGAETAAAGGGNAA